MDIGLLSMSMNVYSTRRIADEAKKLGHYIEWVDHTKCAIKIGAHPPQIIFRQENIIDAFDAIIPRIGTKVTRHGVAVVKQFEMNRVFSTAHSLGISRARNKARALQIVAHNKIAVPDTLFSIDPENISAQIDALGGAPVVIKLQEGTQGLGVILAETKKSAKSIIDTFYKMETHILVQEYIKESNGEDIRVFVVGDKIVAAMKRSCELDDFRSNLHRGGTTQTVKLSSKEQDMALNAAKYIGLGVAGVDLIRSKKGPLLLEVNASPGLQGIESVSGVNVAKEIILFVERSCRKRKR
ncbi:RimK family alpha-L-glutamate ligase [Zobellia galactanivorans]|nr:MULTISPECIES: RimK family alpha-L-glutamate ligase [Zobellia]MBU3026622.1 RimK family alpha-L-glutamate ligase [Zobellia galactanivorans]MDO6809236.1 RimK family alpha-L-glutamate ligase [Zobellia galactanivorans]OWW26885.1 alpha-L-glutamate ligase [Zobellia sp. OII3]